MASIFSFQDEPPRIHSPWSTPGDTTPRIPDGQNDRLASDVVTKLEPERHDGPCEYKLHLLLRPRRKFMSTSTTSTVFGPTFSKSSIENGQSISDVNLHRMPLGPSAQSRHARLQQLTTQLLWRLQQSSPFHSSSNAQLVLPVLPEATPRLGIPERPAKLLPGLEESQGALYEIGVADNGTLVGLVEDELEESLGNLRAMAASLGCVVDILRRMVVGTCEWNECQEENGQPQIRTAPLLVAEVLVRPDSMTIPEVLLKHKVLIDNVGSSPQIITAAARGANVEQMRVAVIGASAVGKSSLVGTLTTSILDNGRGKSRLSLLKHRHEIASGITSSVAQELVGYVNKPELGFNVVNYASGDVSSWTDIHNLADRLVFLSDSPGLPRFAKSMFRSVISWNPGWTVFCISADENEDNTSNSELTIRHQDTPPGSVPATTDLSLVYLDLCLRLKLPLMVVVTKMDLANKSGLRSVLSKVLTALKNAERKPILLTSSASPVMSFALDSADAVPNLQVINEAEENDVGNALYAIQRAEAHEVVPILMTSTVSGSGISKLHALLRSLPVTKVPMSSASEHNFQETNIAPHFGVDEVFSIPPSRVYTSEQRSETKQYGVVLCGHLHRGKISVGDQLCIGPFTLEEIQRGPIIQRSKSHSAYDMRQVAMSLSASVARSYHESEDCIVKPDMKVIFIKVKVVSIRTLRLPVMAMQASETGTIGIESFNSTATTSQMLQKARKGMILCGKELPAYRSFAAVFPASDFTQSSSPPLILGGHAIVYLNNVRAAVKVTAVTLLEDEDIEPASPDDLFAFDAESDAIDTANERDDMNKNIKITFRFGSTVECMQMGDQVLVVPTVTASGPVTGPPVVSTGMFGFVGMVTDGFM